MGNIQIVQAEQYIYIANMLGQQGMRTGSNGVPIRFEAVRECLEKLVLEAERLNASVHMPRIGCGLAGGKWDRVEPIIKETLIDKGIQVTIYDF